MEVTDNRIPHRRREDFPVLVFSQDYELFFQKSGSIEKCLIEPCELLLDFAKRTGVRTTFFVDAGMLCRMQSLQQKHPSLGKTLSVVQEHVASLFAAGHEIGLHIHPHWEDTEWRKGEWDFANSRYKLREFSDANVADIVSRYTAALNGLCDGSVRTYRAGGFCIEPFGQLRAPLLDNSISIDSSVVPGARLMDPEKGFEFSGAPDDPWWTFEESPTVPSVGGTFLEIPITPLVLPIFHYWGRALDRLRKRQPRAVQGDGLSKALGHWEILRRLAGAGRVSELSVDAAKSRQLTSIGVRRQHRKVWHVMGHPKLLDRQSLTILRRFIEGQQISRFDTISGLASAIRAQPLAPSKADSGAFVR